MINDISSVRKYLMPLSLYINGDGRNWTKNKILSLLIMLSFHSKWFVVLCTGHLLWRYSCCVKTERECHIHL